MLFKLNLFYFLCINVVICIYCNSFLVYDIKIIYCNYILYLIIYLCLNLNNDLKFRNGL